MASTAISAITTLISGQAPPTAHATTFGTGETIIVYGPAGGDIDFSTLALRVANSSSGTAILGSITAQGGFTDEDLGDYSFTVASGATVYIGGEGFESARFKAVSAGTAYCTITIGAASAGCKIEAVQAPYSHTG